MPMSQANVPVVGHFKPSCSVASSDWMPPLEQTRKSRSKASRACSTTTRLELYQEASDSAHWLPRYCNRRTGHKFFNLPRARLEGLGCLGNGFALLESAVFFASRARPMEAMKTRGRSDFHQHPPRQSALGQDLKAGFRSSHTLYTAPPSRGNRHLCRQSESKKR